jgi:predicted SprT family Zn-dependent metalloprotease
MKFPIPRTVKLMGRTFKVTLVPNLKDEDGEMLWGDSLADAGYIRLNPAAQQDVLEQTFFHELTHVILEMAGKEKLSADEAFVDLMASLWHQAMTSRRGNAPTEETK